MKQGAVRILQTELERIGTYSGPVDGKLHPELAATIAGMIENRRADLSSDPADWSDKRKRVAAFQLICKDGEFDPGPIDGLWGQRTESAYFAIDFFHDTGERLINFRDIEPSGDNPNNWPADSSNQSEVMDFYDFNPNRGGEPATVIVDCPWQLTLDFNRSVKTQRIGCHPKVADSLNRVLTKIHSHYGTDEINELGLNIYGGCKNVRRKRGGSTWSTHSFAAAIDWDPANNKLQWGFDRAHMARPVYLPFWQAWEEEGWTSLGRAKNFDWMHVQAVRLT